MYAVVCVMVLLVFIILLDFSCHSHVCDYRLSVSLVNDLYLCKVN